MSDAAILALARHYAEQRGWPWRDPVNVSAIHWNGKIAVQVETNFGNRGTNTRLVMTQSEGAVLHAAFLPR